MVHVATGTAATMYAPPPIPFEGARHVLPKAF
jgi:hypothetical protein